MKNVELVWSTPNAEELLVKIARVSNPESAERGENNSRLIKYLVDKQHWSPFEMVNACVSIKTTRDISRQLLRHRSFSFQEFSQRYAKAEFSDAHREARLQDSKNRQNSIETDDAELRAMWESQQDVVRHYAETAYNMALEWGIAKEQARAVLPEGLTKTHLYMNGNMRSWMHFCNLRTSNGTQKETQEIARSIDEVCAKLWPVSWKALRKET